MIRLPPRSTLVPYTTLFRSALLTEPVLRRANQLGSNFGPEAFEQPPLSRARGHMALHQIVDLRADPADDAAIALGEPELRPAMPEPGVFLRIDQAMDLGLERGHPGRVLAINLPSKVDKGAAVCLGDDWANGDVAAHDAGVATA